MNNEDNRLELSADGDRIKTLQDLIEANNIDLDEWKIDSYKENKWEFGYKDAVTGEPVICPLYQVKATLIKNKPIAILPEIKPVSINVDKYTVENDVEHLIEPHYKYLCNKCSGEFNVSIKSHKKHKCICGSTNLTKLGKVEASENGLKKAFILPDCHIGFRRDIKTSNLTPFHDRRNLDIILKITSDQKPDDIIISGDFLDMNAWSDKFMKEAEFYWTTQPALIEAAWFLGQLRRLNPTANIIFLIGNHEFRLKKAISTYLIEAYGLSSTANLDTPILSYRNLLDLDKLNIKVIENPNEGHWINDNFKVIHGNVSKKGHGETVKEFLKDIRCSINVSHIHKSEMTSKTVVSKNKKITYSASSFGCLCRIDGEVPGSEDNNWTQGFGIITYEKNNGGFHTVPVIIDNGRCICFDRIYVGNSYLNDLRRDTKTNF